MAFINKKPLMIILGFLVTLQLSLFYYYSLSVDREYRTQKAALASQAVMLTSSIEERVSILNGISSFIQTVGIDAEPTIINHYLATAYKNSKQIMNIIIAPDGIISYLHPLSGNQAILHKNLFLDPTLSSLGLIQETLNSRQITIDGPRILAQGDYGMVIRQALFEGDSFTGIVSVTLRLDDILEDFTEKNSQIYVTNQDHSFDFGNSSHDNKHQITVPIQIYNQQWLVRKPLSTSTRWEVLRSVLWIDITFLLIVWFILYYFWHQRRFNHTLERVVRTRTRELRVSKRLYEKLANYDILTEIPNRRFFMNELDRLLRAAEPTQTYTLFFFDLNKFKEINDTLGHTTGDQVILTLSKRLNSSDIPFTLFARIGGNEFVMLFGNMPVENIPEIAERISTSVAETIYLAGAQLNLSTSIGISLYPEHSIDKEDLLKYADSSMYQAKTLSDSNFFLFNWELQEKMQQKNMISKYLHSALEREEFVLHYQPQMNAVTGKMIGLEALIRWNHPEKGLIGPGNFIAAVEDAGLMIQLTDWVLQEVCRQLNAWREDGMTLLRTSINISNSWFYNRNLMENLDALLAQYQLETKYLEFEITESTALLEEHYPLLQQIRDQGIVVSIDDFGTKYSSLNYLKHFPVNKIKIDRTFVTGIGTSSIDETIIKSIIFVASQLGYELIAEGVETLEQAEFLTQHNCTNIQGFLFYTPLPAEEIRKLNY